MKPAMQKTTTEATHKPETIESAVAPGTPAAKRPRTHHLDTREAYMQDIAAFERITPEREQELSRILQNPATDEASRDAAMNELIEANLRLVLHCVKQFERHTQSTNAPLSNLDLIAEGNIGLMKAARSFNAHYQDDSKPVRFCTYACKCINSHMIRAIKKARFIHIPEHHFAYWTEIESIRREAGRDLSDAAIRQQLNVSEEAFSLFQKSAETRMSLLEEHGAAHRDEGQHWSERFSDPTLATPCEEAERDDLRAFLFEQIEQLPPRTGKMLSMMYFNENTPSLKDLSHLFGVSSERCRQICAQGIQALRRQMLARRERIADDLGIRGSTVAA